MLRLFAALSALALLAACDHSSAGAPIAEQWRAVEVTATPIRFPRAEVGRLRFRGGLELTSRDAVFGGLSGMEALDGDRLLIMNDDAEWFDTHVVLNDEGALVGLDHVRYAMMRDGDGDPYHGRGGDTEGLAQLQDGRFAVSFEQSQTIRIFDLNRDGPFGNSVAGPRLAETRRLPPNAGLEALTIMADGALLVGAEGGGPALSPLWRVPLDANQPAPPLIGYPPALGYSLTALDRLPDGGFVALERFYAPIIGPRARITRFREEDLNSGAERLADMEELASLTPPMPLDNFEGVAATRMPDGATRIYIVSDDNYSPRQRTLLLAFDIIEIEEASPMD